MKNKYPNKWVGYDKMCYTEFIAHLTENNIQYMEETDVDIDFWFDCYRKVTPIESRLKERYFSEDGGHQLFN